MYFVVVMYLIVGEDVSWDVCSVYLIGKKLVKLFLIWLYIIMYVLLFFLFFYIFIFVLFLFLFCILV